MSYAGFLRKKGKNIITQRCGMIVAHKICDSGTLETYERGVFMRRIDKVYATVREMTEKLTISELLEDHIDINAGSISILLNCERSNVSRDLNELAEAGRLIKIQGRPVSFLERSELEKLLNVKIGLNIKSFSHVSELLGNKDDTGFEDTIGAEGSLKTAIEQAKASILYPPKGLNIMLTGPTGVGKTTFSEHIFQFAKEKGRISEKGKLVIFNCSEYASNPQLLLGQLFGHVKGAFTGADTDKSGLVEEADGGILLLDEIHRLSPEGQEMFFLLLDKGIYRKLGETHVERKAELMIIGATTENTDSALLKTFMRRFHMLIQLPSLEERPLEERFQMLGSFFAHESRKMGVPISIEREVIYKLMTYPCVGNIGQLKADIQLICARGFLDYLSYRDENIYVDTLKLPKHISDGEVGQGRWTWQELNRVIGKQDFYKVNPESSGQFLLEAFKEEPPQGEKEGSTIEIILVRREDQEDVRSFIQEEIEKRPDHSGFLILSEGIVDNLFLKDLKKKYKCEIALIQDFTSSMLEEAQIKLKNPNIFLGNFAHQLVQNQVNRYVEQLNLLKNVAEGRNERKVILTTCMTGEGSAVKIANLISDSIQELSIRDVHVLPMNIARYEKIHIQRDIENDVIAVVGTVDLGMENIPYISLDSLVLSDGIEQLKKIIGMETNWDFSEEEMGKIRLLLADNTQFLDVRKLIDTALEAFDALHMAKNGASLKSLKVRYLLHCACMIERVIQNKNIEYIDILNRFEKNSTEVKILKRAMTVLEETFSISLPDDEIGFLLDLVYAE